MSYWPLYVMEKRGPVAQRESLRASSFQAAVDRRAAASDKEEDP